MQHQSLSQVLKPKEAVKQVTHLRLTLLDTIKTHQRQASRIRSYRVRHIRNYKRLPVLRTILTFSHQNGSCLATVEVVYRAAVTLWAILTWWQVNNTLEVDVGSSKLSRRALGDLTKEIATWKWCRRRSGWTFHIEGLSTNKTGSKCHIYSNVKTWHSRSKIAPIKKALTLKIRYKKSCWVCKIQHQQYSKRAYKRQHWSLIQEQDQARKCL